jgi:hypothetical protein
LFHSSICLPLGLLIGIQAFGAEPAAASVTFYKDVLPIMQKNCQGCHRPGEIGPMSFLTYDSTRPWAKAIKSAILTKKMPPWFADPKYGHFSNDRRLTDAQINTLVSWVDAGAPEGDPKDKPAPMKWREGWNIQADDIFQMPDPYTVTAAGLAVDERCEAVRAVYSSEAVKPGRRAGCERSSNGASGHEL